MNKTLWNWRHVREIWYFISTRQVRAWIPSKEGRILGPKYFYYDGSFYMFGFWFFTVGADAFKDRERGSIRWDYFEVMEKILNHKFKRY